MVWAAPPRCSSNQLLACRVPELAHGVGAGLAYFLPVRRHGALDIELEYPVLGADLVLGGLGDEPAGGLVLRRGSASGDVELIVALARQGVHGIAAVVPQVEAL